MENVDRYIGIPHKFNGRSFDGCDCIGLCALFYGEHGWAQNFSDGNEITQDWEKRDPMRLARYLEKNFTRVKTVDELCFGDVLLFNVCGDSHLGIYLEYGGILAMQVPVEEGKTTSTIYHKDVWYNGFKAGFKRE